MREAARRAGAPVPGELSRSWTVLALVALLEAGLLAVSLDGTNPLIGAAPLLALAYLLLAFRSPDLAWMLAFAAVPFSTERTLPFGAAISVPSEPMIALALGAWGLRLLREGAPAIRGSALHRPLAALAAVALLSVAWGGRPVVGIKAWVVMAGYATFGFLYPLATPWDAARRERWVRLVAAVGALWGVYGALRVLAEGVSLRSAYGAARPFFTEHGTYAAFLSMLLPIPMIETMERRGTARLACAAASAAIALGVALSYTRAAWVAIAVVMPVALLAWAIRKRALRTLGVPAVVLALLTSGIAVSGIGGRLVRHAETIGATENVSNLERVNRWMAALEMAREHPVIGVGYGGYPDAYRTYRRKVIVTEEVFGHFGPHNELLGILSETGIVGLLAALWFLGTLGAAGWRAFRRATDPASGRLALGVLAGLSTYAIHALFNSYLGLDKVTAPFWLGVGAIAALDPGRAGRPPNPGPSRTVRA